MALAEVVDHRALDAPIDGQAEAQRQGAALLLVAVLAPMAGTTTGAWWRRGACRGLAPATVVPEVCQGCPVRLECLSGALVEETRSGCFHDLIRGGTASPERRRLRLWGESLGATGPDDWGTVAAWFLAGDLDPSPTSAPLAVKLQ